MRSFQKTAVALVIFLGLSGGGRVANGQSNMEGVIDGAETVDEAVALIRETLDHQGFDIPLVVNHAAAAASIGEDLRDTQVIMARPRPWKERRILRRSPTVGIDLPIKILVFEDEDGDLQLRYNPPGYLIDRHDLLVIDPLVWSMEADLEQFGELDDGLVTIESERSYRDTIEALRAAISASGAFAIPLELEFEPVHHGGPDSTRRATVLVFGNPTAGTPLMQVSQEIALDLPQKFLIRKTRSGDVTITHNDPFFIAKRHAIVGQDTLLGNIANALRNFAAAGAGGGG